MEARWYYTCVTLPQLKTYDKTNRDFVRRFITIPLTLHRPIKISPPRERGGSIGRGKEENERTFFQLTGGTTCNYVEKYG
jgi:hypothetical protein